MRRSLCVGRYAADYALTLSVHGTVVDTHMIFAYVNKFDVSSRLRQFYRRDVARNNFESQRQSLAINLSLATVSGDNIIACDLSLAINLLLAISPATSRRAISPEFVASVRGP